MVKVKAKSEFVATIPTYQAAAVEMIAKTSLPDAPWTLVEAQDKRWARVKVLKTVADRLEEEL